MIYSNYSVLMSVYFKEKPDYLRDSILSMLQQTVAPDEIVLVKDGPLTSELDKVLEEFKEFKEMKIITLDKNVGLGLALNIGLKVCKNELVARMDTDDISIENRCEIQLEMFKKNSELSVLGTSVEEFIDNTNNVVGYKDVKKDSDEINKQMKFRNPIIHPTVMFKKSHVLNVGSYKDWFLNEDYYLWIRMLQQGYIFKNIKDPLVKMRINDETYLRRGGWKYFVTQKRLFDYMLKIGAINRFQYIYNNSIRFVIRLMIPNNLRKLFYLKVMRKKRS